MKVVFADNLKINVEIHIKTIEYKRSDFNTLKCVVPSRSQGGLIKNPFANTPGK